MRNVFVVGRLSVLFVVLALSLPIATAAQSDEDRNGAGLSLTVHDWGVAFGNVPRIKGLRFNLRDSYLESISGLNVTAWRHKGDVGGTVKGVSIGLAQHGAGRNMGLMVALGGSVADREMWGIAGSGLANVAGRNLTGGFGSGLANVAGADATGFFGSGLANVAGADATGFFVSGLANVAGNRVTGMSLSGLANVAGAHYHGFSLAGLATVAGGDFRGIAVSGLAMIAGGSMSGVSVSGLATVGAVDLTGIHVSGLALVGGRTVSGINVAGLSVVGDRGVRGIAVGVYEVRSKNGTIQGLSLGGLRVRARKLRGLNFAAGYTTAQDVSGLTLAPYNRAQGLMVGLQVGIFNTAEVLRGVQIGLLNHAANNSAPFRWLPFFNFHAS